MSQQDIVEMFLGIILIYAILIGIITYWYARSGVREAHENYPKTVKTISQSFVTIIIFLLLFYLALAKLIPTDVLITLVSVFATAGFLTFKDK